MSDLHSAKQFCRRTRREFLWESGAGFGALGLTGLLSNDGLLNRASGEESTPADHEVHQPNGPEEVDVPGQSQGRYLCLHRYAVGRVGQVDTYDYKPELYKLDGKTITVKTFGRGGHKNVGRVVGPKWQFKPYGKCGKLVSDVFPHTATCVDDIAFVHSFYAESPIHGSGLLMMNSGRLLSGSPCIGSWVTYGLGSENENLPGFVVMLDHTGGPISGPKNWSSGYMPAAYQGVQIRADKTPIHDLALPPGNSTCAVPAARTTGSTEREERGAHGQPGR